MYVNFSFYVIVSVTGTRLNHYSRYGATVSLYYVKLLEKAQFCGRIHDPPVRKIQHFSFLFCAWASLEQWSLEEKFSKIEEKLFLHFLAADMVENVLTRNMWDNLGLLWRAYILKFFYLYQAIRNYERATFSHTIATTSLLCWHIFPLVVMSLEIYHQCFDIIFDYLSLQSL